MWTTEGSLPSWLQLLSLLLTDSGCSVDCAFRISPADRQFFVDTALWVPTLSPWEVDTCGNRQASPRENK